MSTTARRILLVGATGYIGGTLLDHLIKSEVPAIQGQSFDLFVRGEEPAKQLREVYKDRVNPIQWKGLSDIEFIRDTAANYDIIINVGSGFIPDGAKAFVEGLARRVKPGTEAPWILHVSGCTNLSDEPLTGTAFPERAWADADGSVVYEYMKSEDARAPYPQRTAELNVLTTAEEAGVHAVSLNAPILFGKGTGLFDRPAIAAPLLIRFAAKHGFGFKLNDTSNFNWVHVEDLADAYILLLRAILEREDRGVGYIPTGKNGVLFPVAGESLHVDAMQLALDAVFDAGILPRDDTPKEKEIRQAELQYIADELMGGYVPVAERGYAGHKLQHGTVLKKLGWTPTRLEDAFRQDFADEARAFAAGENTKSIKAGELLGVTDTTDALS